MNDRDFEVLIVTGMSGAGRSTAARALEDAGWFVVDNLPPSLLAATWTCEPGVGATCATTAASMKALRCRCSTIP